jgi:hypothetical protein
MTHDQMSEQCTRRPDGAYLIESVPNYRQYHAAKAAREIVERVRRRAVGLQVEFVRREFLPVLRA